MALTYYLDTYALIEIEKGNTTFAKYTLHPFCILDLTLAEFYSKLLQTHNTATADYWWQKLEGNIVRASNETLKKAVQFRHKHKKINISFVDSLGYTHAQQNKLLFVTGDKEFANRIGVEYVK